MPGGAGPPTPQAYGGVDRVEGHENMFPKARELPDSKRVSQVPRSGLSTCSSTSKSAASLSALSNLTGLSTTISNALQPVPTPSGSPSPPSILSNMHRAHPCHNPGTRLRRYFPVPWCCSKGTKYLPLKPVHFSETKQVPVASSGVGPLASLIALGAHEIGTINRQPQISHQTFIHSLMFGGG